MPAFKAGELESYQYIIEVLMVGRIYLLNKNAEVMALEESPYESEKLLQELLAEHPDLLAGEQINSDEPRQWLLVDREMSVPDEESGTHRWSLDHLFLDQDAIPTIVEVKRSSDSRIRREVIGQMLDYAANAVAYWPMDEIRGRFQRRCEIRGEDAEETLYSFLDENCDIDDFWLRVKTNLQAGRVRLVFLADTIPAELRRVVEFLNVQMDPAEVLAIEVKQYIGKEMKTLVPRVLGQTESARQKKSSRVKSSRQWNELTFFESLKNSQGEDECEVARECLAWAQAKNLRIWWGRGQKNGSFYPMYDNEFGKNFLYSVRTTGKIEIQFQFMTKPPFQDVAARRELSRRLEDISGVSIPDEALNRRPVVHLEQLIDPAAINTFLQIFDWVLSQIRAQEKSHGAPIASDTPTA